MYDTSCKTSFASPTQASRFAQRNSNRNARSVGRCCHLCIQVGEFECRPFPPQLRSSLNDSVPFSCVSIDRHKISSTCSYTLCCDQVCNPALEATHNVVTRLKGRVWTLIATRCKLIDFALHLHRLFFPYIIPQIADVPLPIHEMCMHLRHFAPGGK